MIEIKVEEDSNNFDVLGKYIHSKKEFYTFNEDSCEIEIRILKSFGYEYLDTHVISKPNLKLTFYNLGKEETSISLEPGEMEVTGIPSMFKGYESKEECIQNLNSHFVQKVMCTTLDPKDTGESMAMERITKWYKFRKLYLQDWIQEYPQIML